MAFGREGGKAAADFEKVPGDNTTNKKKGFAVLQREKKGA